MPEPSRPLPSSHDCRRVSSASHLLGGREGEGGREREKEREGGRDIKVMQALPHAYKYLNMCNTHMYMHYTSYHALSC